jgi:hypothetical protein
VKSLRQGDSDTFGLIITRRKGSEILTSSDGAGAQITYIEIPPKHRVAEQLTSAVLSKMGLRAYCLLVYSCSTSALDQEAAKYALLECPAHDAGAPSGYGWHPFDRNVPLDASSPEDNFAIAEALRRVHVSIDGETPGPFGRPGWLSELLDWAEAQIHPLGLRTTGGFRQLNASSAFSLIRIETSGPAMWFKATGEPNRHELSVTRSLARLFPEFVPAIRAVHSAWNGWLSEEAVGTSLGDLSEFSAWECAARDLAELQIRSIGKHLELVENKCKDLRLPKLIEQIDPFLERMAHLMTAQEKSIPPPLSSPELIFLGNQLKWACSLLQDFRIPETLGHLDLNPGNIFPSQGRTVFLDWAEGCVANPLITFEYLREHLTRKDPDGQQPMENLAEAYRRPWRSLFSPGDLEHAMMISPLVAVFAFAVSTKAWRSADSPVGSVPNGYLRSLTRRMYREAALLAERNESCPA